MALPYELVTTEPVRLGLVVLQSDETIEADMRRMLPEEMELLVTRVPSATVVSQESLQDMAEVLTASALLFPRGADFAAVGYGCTSGSAQIGTKQIASLVKAGVETGAVTEPVSALIAACSALDVTRIGMISPYVAQVSGRLVEVLKAHGITVTVFDSFDEPLEKNVVRIAPQSLISAAKNVAQGADIEAVFLSCTNLRTLDVIDALEADLGLPVLSSNQVLAWHMVQLAGGGAPRFGAGKLWGQTARGMSKSG